MHGGTGEVGDLIAALFRDSKRETHVTLSALRQHWAGIVGAQLANRTHPLRLKGGVLWVAAKDSAWVYELQFFKEELLCSVNTFLESGEVKELRFRLGEIPPPEGEAAASPAHPGTAAKDQPPPDPQAQALANAIPESTLRKRFLRAYSKRRRTEPDPREANAENPESDPHSS